MDGSGYWMLRPAVQAYLLNKSLSAGEIAAMRAYLRHAVAFGIDPL